EPHDHRREEPPPNCGRKGAAEHDRCSPGRERRTLKDPSPRPPPRSGEGEKDKIRSGAGCRLKDFFCSPSPLRGGGREEGLCPHEPHENSTRRRPLRTGPAASPAASATASVADSAACAGWCSGRFDKPVSAFLNTFRPVACNFEQSKCNFG